MEAENVTLLTHNTNHLLSIHCRFHIMIPSILIGKYCINSISLKKFCYFDGCIHRDFKLNFNCFMTCIMLDIKECRIIVILNMTKLNPVFIQKIKRQLKSNLILFPPLLVSSSILKVSLFSHWSFPIYFKDKFMELTVRKKLMYILEICHIEKVLYWKEY